MRKFIYEDYISDISNISSAEDVEKRIMQVNNDYGVILQYRLGDAWGMPDYSLLVFDRDKENILSINNKNEMKFDTITQEELDDIKEYLMKNEILYDEDMLEVPTPLFDGTTDNFIISLNDKFIEIECDNLWYWLENDVMESHRLLKDEIKNNVDNEIDEVGNVEYTKAIVDLLILLKNILGKHNLELQLYLDEDDQEEQ